MTADTAEIAAGKVHVRVATGDGVLLVSAGQVLDVASMPSLTHALRRALDERRHLVLETAELQELAAAPFGAVVSAAAHLQRQQLKLVAVCGPGGLSADWRRIFAFEGIACAGSVTEAVLMTRRRTAPKLSLD